MLFFNIIIPLYNKENFVEKTLQSVLNQTYSNYEVIIINDCSTDNSVLRVSPYLNEIISIHHHKENKGLSAARNTGIKLAKSDYIVFLDADDCWKETFLEEIYSMIISHKNEFVFATNYEVIYDKKLYNSILKINNSLEKVILIDDFFKESLQYPLYIPSSLCVNKSVFDVVGLYNEKITFAEDIDMCLRIHKKFKLVFFTKPLVSYYMQTENQITKLGIGNKIIPDFDSFEPNENNTLKKYLDFQRYSIGLRFKYDNNFMTFDKLKSKIYLNNLNTKQKILLYMTSKLYKEILHIKNFLLKHGIRFTTFN